MFTNKEMEVIIFMCESLFSEDSHMQYRKFGELDWESLVLGFGSMV